MFIFSRARMRTRLLECKDLVRKMLNRIEEQRLHDRLEEVMMQPHTEGLLFTPQAAREMPCHDLTPSAPVSVVRCLAPLQCLVREHLQANSEQIPSQIFEVLPSQNVVRLLTRSPGILTRQASICSMGMRPMPRTRFAAV